jgi:hypothetical protein
MGCKKPLKRLLGHDAKVKPSPAANTLKLIL